MFTFSQTGTIRGFVYEEASEEVVIFANVFVSGTDFGTSTDDNGYFIISDIPYGKYKLQVSFIGYKDYFIDFELNNEIQVITKKCFLTTESLQLDNITINAARDEMKTQVNTGVVKLTSKTINKLPSIGGEPDLAQFLQVLPGVVFTGDQGGQIYIRGGAPIHNKVLLDGMVVYSPFHSIGFFSVFDTDIIKKADIYTGGFGAQYGGRISSIMDIKTRDGNKKRLAGKISGNTFSSKLLLEGPIIKSKNDISNSFLLSAKKSYLDITSKSIYSYLNDTDLPYSFLDIYGKMSFSGKTGSKLNIYGFGFNDDVDYQNITNLNWTTYGFGSNLILVPSSAKMLIEGKLAYSNYEINQQNHEEPLNSSIVDGFNVGLDFFYFISKKHELKYGAELLGYTTELLFRNSANTLIEHEDHSTEFAAYVNYKFNNGNGRLILEPSLRLQNYTSLGETSLEPRAGLKYNLTERIRLKSSFGLFSQNLMSSTSERNVINLFSGFLSSTTSLPTTFQGEVVESSLQKATHFLLGFEYDLGAKIDINIEGYIKDFSQLISQNNNQIYTDTPEFEDVPDYQKKIFIIEKGLAKGLDFLIKYNSDRINLWTVYSYGIINREDEESIYYPHYDRRHNVNLLLSYLIDSKKNWELSLRWNYGSGFPFTKTKGYYENINLNNGANTDIYTLNGELGVLYADLNTGRLPEYHRLDLSIKRIFKFNSNNHLEISFGVTNLYDRDNIFYYNRINAVRVNQLPIMPSLGINWSF
tara:strand:- start:1650 stop:3911 length:2262 start_codon:yes stop_codon:yes gene_type:complete